jgi:hypothetical protein
VLDDIAPDGWERSPLFACLHSSVERVFEEELGPVDDPGMSSGCSVAETAAADLKAQRHRAGIARVRAELVAIHTRAREEA